MLLLLLLRLLWPLNFPRHLAVGAFDSHAA
jgi:hypothetical protein